MDAVCSGDSGIVIYGGGDIVFGAKRSNQRMQWMQYAVRSGIVVYGGGDIVFDSKTSNQWIQCMQSHSGHSTQWTQYAVDTVCSGCSKHAVCSGYSMQWMQYAVDTVE